MTVPVRTVDARDAVEAMESLLDGLIHLGGVRHATVGIGDLQGGWSWSEAAGTADAGGRRMAAQTPWLLASVSKLHIAAIVLRLAEQGRIDLGAPITEYLPDDLAAGLHVYRGKDRTGELTATHLLGHMSGLPDWLEEAPPGGRSWMNELVDGGDRAWRIEDAVRHARDRLSPHFAPSVPGARRPRVRYSDTNFQLLMLIGEAAAGADFDALFGELIAGPLDLEDTGSYDHFPSQGERAPASPWYGRRSLGSFPLALRSFRDLFGTTGDLLAFGRALFTGAIFDRPETLELMRSRFLRFGLPRGAAGLSAPSWPIEYGLGMMRFGVSRLLAGGRKLPVVVGHTGATGSWLWHVPELGLVCAGTVDQTDRGALPFRRVPRALSGLSG